VPYYRFGPGDLLAYTPLSEEPDDIHAHLFRPTVVVVVNTHVVPDTATDADCSAYLVQDMLADDYRVVPACDCELTGPLNEMEVLGYASDVK